MDRGFTLFKNAPAAALTAAEEQSASGPGGMPAGGEEAGCASLIKESHREGLWKRETKSLSTEHWGHRAAKWEQEKHPDCQQRWGNRQMAEG